MDNKLLNSPQSTFSNQLDPTQVTNEEEGLFDLSLDDDQLYKLCTNQLTEDINHWEQEPWLLTLTDKENVAYLLGNQQDAKVTNNQTQTPYVDNRLFASVRATLSYATGLPAKPELLPSKPDDISAHVARQTGAGLYQHVLDHDVNSHMRLAVKNLITRKRGFLKLRYDDDAGPYGDICSENVDPSDIVIDRFAGFQTNPARIWHKQKATIEQLVEKFPDKKDDIFNHFGIKRGVSTQVTRMVTYWECWFTYMDQDEQAEGVCWIIPDSTVVLGKMKNPNWLEKGSQKQQMIENICYKPIKPFICLNYWNTGRSFIDETCLFDQARPLQDALNKRSRQLIEAADYANPRVIVNGAIMDEADAKKFVNKNPKTIGITKDVGPELDITKSIMVIPAPNMPAYVVEDVLRQQTELDTMMGTPVQFRGQQPTSKNPTLGQDLLIKNQAQSLQDDLVVVINRAWQEYYKYLLHMMNVYLDDDYYVITKGKEGEYNHIMLSQDNIDSNVRVTVTVDSTLPLDKQSQRATAIQLAQMNRIDDLSLFEILGLPEPEKLAERKLRWEIDRYTYMQSIEQKLLSHEAEMDIQLLIQHKEPEDRDDYNEDYLNHWNLFMSSQRFFKLDRPTQNRLTDFLHMVTEKAAITEGLRGAMLNPAGILDRPPIFPMPKREIRYNVRADAPPEAGAELAAEGQLAIPITQGQPPTGGQPSAPGGSPPAPVGQASQPRLQNPGQFK